MKRGVLVRQIFLEREGRAGETWRDGEEWEPGRAWLGWGNITGRRGVNSRTVSVNFHLICTHKFSL